MTEPNDKDMKERTETTPGGLDVRTPSRDEFFGNLRRVSRPDPEPEAESDEKASSRPEK